MLYTAGLVRPGSGAESTGSGFLIHPDGYLLTNHHVIAGSSQQQVVLPDGRVMAASIVKTDSTKDLALLKIGGRNYPTLPVGESRRMSVMDPVLALGFPMSSAIGTEISAYDGKINAFRQHQRTALIQIDANVNPGNSGGPLLNEYGEVIGVVVAKLNAIEIARVTGTIPERINFAIPIDEAKELLSVAYPSGFQPSQRSTVLRNQAIFSDAKQATVFILATTGKVAAAEAAPEVRSPVLGSEPATPIPEQELKTVSLRPSLQAFVSAFIASGEDSGLDAALQFYAPKVVYHDKGLVDRTFIRRELSTHRKRWPRRSYKLVEGPTVKVGSDPSQFFVLYDLEFAVQNDQKTLEGTSHCTLLIEEQSGDYKVKLIREQAE
jgi:V8-like Glu-specific endopeptidase